MWVAVAVRNLDGVNRNEAVEERSEANAATEIEWMENQT